MGLYTLGLLVNTLDMLRKIVICRSSVLKMPHPLSSMQVLIASMQSVEDRLQSDWNLLDPGIMDIHTTNCSSRLIPGLSRSCGSCGQWLFLRAICLLFKYCIAHHASPLIALHGFLQLIRDLCWMEKLLFLHI